MRNLLANRGVRHLFHFTDVSNIRLIKMLGGLYSWEKLSEMEVENVCPGGNDVSHAADYSAGVEKFVHLCFLQDHPMEYVARKDGRISQTAWIKVDLGVLDNVRNILFTPGVSNKTGMPLLTADQAKEQLDFQALYEFIDFSVEGNMDRKNLAKKYEILIPDHVPLCYLEF